MIYIKKFYNDDIKTVVPQWWNQKPLHTAKTSICLPHHHHNNDDDNNNNNNNNSIMIAFHMSFINSSKFIKFKKLTKAKKQAYLK